MKYQEKHIDLFTVNKHNQEPYCLAQCISQDMAMAGGIALEFNKHYNVKNRLTAKYKDKPVYVNSVLPLKEHSLGGEFVIFNLVTKAYVGDLPEYDALCCALINMSLYMTEHNLTKLAIPKLGCGIDRLEWERVKRIIKLVFEKLPIEVLVCIKEGASQNE